MRPCYKRARKGGALKATLILKVVHRLNPPPAGDTGDTPCQQGKESLTTAGGGNR